MDTGTGARLWQIGQAVQDLYDFLGLWAAGYDLAPAFVSAFTGLSLAHLDGAVASKPWPPVFKKW
jgi:hypothetical protein